MSRRNWGQELTFNEWQIRGQNLLRLVLMSMACGAGTSLLWFSLVAPRGAFTTINLYYYSKFYCAIPFGCSETALYNQRVLQPSIDQLGRSFKSSRVVFVIGTLLSGFLLKRHFDKRGIEAAEERYIRGAKLLTPEVLKAQIDKKFPDLSDGLRLGQEQVRIPEKLTYQHISFAGASGTRKTQAINSLLVQLIGEENHKGLILDSNGQFYSRFGRPEDKVLSLYDQRTEAWDFWCEDAPPEFFAEALVEEDPKDKFFAPAARALLTDLLGMSHSIDDLWEDLTCGAQALLPKLAGGISPAMLGAPNQAAGVIATTSLRFNFLRYLNYWSQHKPPFSLTEWATGSSDEWVYLIFRDQDKAATKPLLRLWFDLATLGVLQRQENGDYPHLWLIADELPDLGQLPSLGKLLSQGRKYRSTAILGYQGASQIDHIYGHDKAKEIFQGTQNKIILRSSDPDTAKRASADLGDQEVEELNHGTQFGSATQSDRMSVNRPIKTRPVVMPAEIQGLPDGHAYVKLSEFNPALIHFDFTKWVQINQPNRSQVPPVRRRRTPAGTTTTATAPDTVEVKPDPGQDPTKTPSKSNTVETKTDQNQDQDNFLVF